MPPLPSCTRSEEPSTSSAIVVRSPSSIVALHDVAWMRRLWPAIAAAPARFVWTESVPSSGPRLYLIIGADHKLRAMAVELDHRFTTSRQIDDSFETILDLDRVVPCVEGGRVVERTAPNAVNAEIVVKMGAMGLTFTGTVEVVEQDPEAHRVVMAVKSREAGGGPRRGGGGGEGGGGGGAAPGNRRPPPPRGGGGPPPPPPRAAPGRAG